MIKALHHVPESMHALEKIITDSAGKNGVDTCKTICPAHARLPQAGGSRQALFKIIQPLKGNFPLSRGKSLLFEILLKIHAVEHGIFSADVVSGVILARP